MNVTAEYVFEQAVSFGKALAEAKFDPELQELQDVFKEKFKDSKIRHVLLKTLEWYYHEQQDCYCEKKARELAL